VIHDRLGWIAVRYFAMHLQRHVVAFLTYEQLKRFPYRCQLAWVQSDPALEHDTTRWTVTSAVGGYLIAMRHGAGLPCLKLSPGDLLEEESRQMEVVP